MKEKMNDPKFPPKISAREQPPSGKLFELVQQQSIIFSDLMVENGEEKVSEIRVEVVFRNGTSIAYSKDLVIEEMMKDEDQ